MGKRILFPSVKQPNIRYCVYESFCDNPTNQKGFNDNVTAFDTYGDGNVQHCHEWSVQADELCDFLESLMLYMAANDPEEWRATMVHMWPNSLDEKHARQVIEFAAKLTYKENKFHQYYNLRECKVSSSESKQHDKRWSRVESWHDGSFASFMWLTDEYRPCGLLGLYSWCEFVFDNSDFSQWDFRKWMRDMEPEPYRRLRDAFETCEQRIRAEERVARCRQWNQSRAESLQQRLAREAEKQAESVVA